MCQNETFSVLTIPANSTPQQLQILSSRLYFKDSVLILFEYISHAEYGNEIQQF